MVGGTLSHNILANRVYNALLPRLGDGPCQMFRSDAPVRTARGTRMRYPDLVVTCSPFRPNEREVPDPVLIVGVLSETTAAIDRGAKRYEYAALPGLSRYVMLAHDAPVAVVCDRGNGCEERLEHEALTLPEFGLTLALAELYEGLLPG